MENVIVTGLSGSGKDSFGNFLARNYGYTIKKLATPIKQGLADLTGIDVNTLERMKENDQQNVRQALQIIGELACSRDTMFWVNKLWQDIKYAGYPIVITDGRKYEEVNYFCNKSYKHIHINRPGLDLTAEKYRHSTESWSELLMRTADLVINNNAETLTEFNRVLAKATHINKILKLEH